MARKRAKRGTEEVPVWLQENWRMRLESVMGLVRNSMLHDMQAYQMAPSPPAKHLRLEHQIGTYEPVRALLEDKPAITTQYLMQEVDRLLDEMHKTNRPGRQPKVAPVPETGEEITVQTDVRPHPTGDKGASLEILIGKTLREMTGISRDTLVNLKVDGRKRIIIEKKADDEGVEQPRREAVKAKRE